MKAHIIDAQALRAISPLALSAYARAEKWVKEESFGDHSDVYVKPGAGEIIIPGTEALGDYVAVVSNLIERFATVEGRDELQVYRDLVGSDRDVVRVRAPQAEADGSVRIDAGVDIVLHARDMLLAAACAAKDPRAAYRAGKIKDAASYMDRVLLGQTEQGSFVVTLLAPVPPNLNQPEQIELWPSLAEEPFERLVTRRLSTALAAAQGAAERSIRGEGMEAFDAVVMSGVSANLCEALTNLIERGDGLDVSITWSKTRLAPEPRRVIEFSRGQGEVFKEAARLFRSKSPRPEERLEGFVIGLDRKQDDSLGTVTLRTFLDGAPVSVKVDLPGEMYANAVFAHERRLPITITGDLKRRGQRWWLGDPANLGIIAVEDDGDATSGGQRS